MNIRCLLNQCNCVSQLTFYILDTISTITLLPLLSHSTNYSPSPIFFPLYLSLINIYISLRYAMSFLLLRLTPLSFFHSSSMQSLPLSALQLFFIYLSFTLPLSLSLSLTPPLLLSLLSPSHIAITLLF